MPQPRNVALAYSGGLDTSVIIPWLKERYPGCRVVAVVADVGQGDDFDEVRAKARASGADAVHVVDVRRLFVTEYIYPALRADAIYEGRYLLGTALARPLIARVQVEVALAEGCDALAHGCTGKGNDQVRFELAYQALAPQLAVIAPWREWSLGSREEEIDYARAHGVPVPVTREKPYSMDQNLWHLSFESGILEDPWAEPPADMFRLTVDPAAAPDAPEYLELGFERGVPVSIDGRALDPVTLVETLNRRAGAHGVGRVDIVENRLVGMKSRGVYETPGRHRADGRASPPADDHARPRHAALQGAAGRPVRRARVQRRLVLAAAPRDRRVRVRHAGDGDRAPCACGCSRGRAPSSAARATGRCTIPGSRRSGAARGTTTRTPRRSSGCSACRPRCSPR